MRNAVRIPTKQHTNIQLVMLILGDGVEAEHNIADNAVAIGHTDRARDAPNATMH